MREFPCQPSDRGDNRDAGAYLPAGRAEMDAVVVLLIIVIVLAAILAVLDARTLTSLRTACVTALGAKYLAKKVVQRIGLVGLGRIGRAVAHRAHHGFGMRVIFHDPYPPPAAVVA